jgi:hypothetical protein
MAAKIRISCRAFSCRNAVGVIGDLCAFFYNIKVSVDSICDITTPPEELFQVHSFPQNQRIFAVRHLAWWQYIAATD